MVRQGSRRRSIRRTASADWAGVRANRYGTVPLDAFVREANASTVVIAQIETGAAPWPSSTRIAGRDGVDVLYVGPNDLTQALGVPGKYGDPAYQRELKRIAATATSAGKTAGIMLARTDQIPALRELGYRFFTMSDRALMFESARAWRAALAKDPGVGSKLS